MGAAEQMTKKNNGDVIWYLHSHSSLPDFEAEHSVPAHLRVSEGFWEGCSGTFSVSDRISVLPSLTCPLILLIDLHQGR